MQMQAQAQAGQLPPGVPGGIPPGLLQAAGGHPGAAGLPTSLSLLAGIPTSLAQAGPSLPHPAFASLLAQKPGGMEALAAKAREEEAKMKAAMAAAETNGVAGAVPPGREEHPSRNLCCNYVRKYQVPLKEEKRKSFQIVYVNTDG